MGKKALQNLFFFRQIDGKTSNSIFFRQFDENFMNFEVPSFQFHEKMGLCKGFLAKLFIPWEKKLCKPVEIIIEFI